MPTDGPQIPVGGGSAVADNERLWRRIHPTWVIANEDGTTRLSSAAFNDHNMSVDRASIREGAGESWIATLGADPARGVEVAELTAQRYRSDGQTVSPDSLLGENLSHALVVGAKSTRLRRKWAHDASRLS